jgi:hypothetical protein
MIYQRQKIAAMNARVRDEADEISLVRDLAAEVSTMAQTTEMAVIRQRWRDVVAMRRPDRPPIWCKPVGCWPELLPESWLVCRNRELREIERHCKRHLIKDAIGDDTPVLPTYDIPAVFRVTPPNKWGFDIKTEQLGEAGTAWRDLPTVVSEADYERLTVPRYAFDEEATMARRDRLQDYLGDAMPVRVNPLGEFFSAATLCSEAARLCGLEEMMMNMVLAPGLVHRLMGVMQQGVMRQVAAVEDSGRLVPNTDTPMFLSDPLRPGNAGGTTLQDCWIHGNSQEFDPVSPAMFEEFLLQYQKPIFARFGAVCYGCCENLTHKLDAVLSIPNLRLLTCSGWTDLGVLVEKAASRCCIMWRHKAADVVCPPDTRELRRKIREQAHLLDGASYQVVLRELQTLMGHGDRLREWTLICQEELSR